MFLVDKSDAVSNAVSTTSYSICYARRSRKKHAVTVIGAGHAHSLACFSDGKRVQCWGRGAHGRLGTGRHLNRNIPTEVSTSDS